MNITEELQKLADLRKNGSLTEQEFAAAKAKLLSAEVSDDSAAVRESNQVQAKAPVPVLDEQRVWQGRSSHWNYFFSWFFALLLCGFGILCVFLYFSNESPSWLPDREPWLFVPLILGLLIIGIIAVKRAGTLYLVTNRKVEVQSGLIVKSSNEIRIKDIRSINVTKHGLAGFIGIGSVEFSSAASDRAEVVFVSISGADKVRDLVTGLQES